MKAKIVILCLLVASAVAQASELDPYQCNEGPPQFHSYGVINPGETRIVDLKPDCIGYLNPENYMQFIIGVTTPTLGYIKRTGPDFLKKLGIQVDLIDAASGISMFSLVKPAGGQICRYAGGTSYEFLNPQLISPAILRPVRVRISNVGSKSYHVHSTVTWVYKQEGAPVENCLKYGGAFL